MCFDKNICNLVQTQATILKQLEDTQIQYDMIISVITLEYQMNI